MRKGTICGVLHTKHGFFALVHPKPIEPDSWQPKEMLRFLVTYGQPVKTEHVEKDGVIQKVGVFGTPFSVIVPVEDTVIVLDRLEECFFEDSKEID